MKPRSEPGTNLCTHSKTALYYRDANLVEDLVGAKSFTEVMFYQIMARFPSVPEREIVDAAMVILMEHGFTPSAITARLIYMSAPENLQGAVAAGLMAVGSQFVGTMENCGALLNDMIRDERGLEAAATEIVQRFRKDKQSLPGFGHHLHSPDDPRALKMLALVREHGVAGPYTEALAVLARELDRQAGRHITINATGAIAAALGEIGVPPGLMRGFAVISRAAGLVSHIAEEQSRPVGRYIWDRIDNDIPYVGKAATGRHDSES